jgi:hypothetical protein
MLLPKGDFFLNQERKIPGNPKFRQSFLCQEEFNLIRYIPGFPDGDGDYLLTV